MISTVGIHPCLVARVWFVCLLQQKAPLNLTLKATLCFVNATAGHLVDWKVIAPPRVNVIQMVSLKPRVNPIQMVGSP